MDVLNIQDEFSNKTLKLSEESFLELKEFVYQQSGILLSDRQKVLLETRLSGRLKTLGLENFSDYVKNLKSPEFYHKEKAFLFEAITISESSFFRDANQIRVLQEIVLPELFENAIQQQASQVRILSAGCAAGEEPYTLAMVIKEKFSSYTSRIPVHIIGVDINSTNLEKARKGVYHEYSMKNIPQEYLQKYWTRDGYHRVLNDEIREMVEFKQLNLLHLNKDSSMSRFDLILCCNVLLYLERQAKVQVVQNLYDALNLPGYLFIGQSESLHGITQAFKLYLFQRAIAYKKE
ncbi:MAG: protein-glutamate O-methyltransferase CheR [Calditrichaeota bacterium]|nr:MAG: protein-glutamate O-methyltransferase CheR [Calditrichota bacterium]